MTARLLVVGSSNTDMVVRTARIPAPGETVLGGDLLVTPGGKGANQAVAAARLGAEVTFLARIGADTFGDQAVKTITESGVSGEYILRDSGAPSGVALISVDGQGQNAIVVAPGSNARLSWDDVERARPAFEQADVVVLQLEIPLDTVRRAIDLARELGKQVILNPAPAPALPQGYLNGIDVLTPNLQEVNVLLGEIGGLDAVKAARALLATGIRAAVVTLGSSGAVAASGDYLDLIPPRKVKVVDTTAAGDCFTAALAVMLAEGRSLPDAAMFANAAASISVTRAGAQTSMPTRQEVEQVVS